MLGYAFVISHVHKYMSPNKFKYRFHYKGEWIYGNSIDAIANSISRDGERSFASAVTLVSKNMIPVYGEVKDQVIPASKNTKKVGIKEASAGAMSALKQIGGGTVPQEEINRRAIICSGCPKISDISGCRSCGFGGKLVKFVNNIKQAFGFGIKIPNDLSSKFCDCCDCSLGMMIPANLIDFQDKTRNDETRPERCWLKRKK